MRGPKTRQRVGWGGSEGVERIAWIRDRGAQPRGVRVGQARDPPKGRAPREKSRVRRVRARVRRARGSRVVDDVSPGRVDAPDARARARSSRQKRTHPRSPGAPLGKRDYAGERDRKRPEARATTRYREARPRGRSCERRGKMSSRSARRERDGSRRATCRTPRVATLASTGTSARRLPNTRSGVGESESGRWRDSRRRVARA